MNSIQKKLINKWNDDSRYTYNKAINILNEEYYDKLTLRNIIIPESCCSRIPWILETPKAIREASVFEAHKNYKSAFTNIKNGNINHFDIRYKKKKKESWTIGVPKTALNIYDKEIGIYESRTTYSRFKLTEKIKNINNDCNIHFDGLNYYLCVPIEHNLRSNNMDNWTCSMDPGNRKFQTIYSPDNDEYTIIGERASKYLYKKLLTLDKLLTNRNKNKKRIKKLRLKIKNLQSELHNKSIKFLCDNYNEINVPKLTKDNDIIKRKNRKINTKVVRNMTVIGHSKFIEKLKAKADLYKNVRINIVTEEYTSQRCLNCDMLTKTSSERYICKVCGYEIDRDILGSTNIYKKFILRDTADVDMRCSLNILDWRKLVEKSDMLNHKFIKLVNIGKC